MDKGIAIEPGMIKVLDRCHISEDGSNFDIVMFHEAVSDFSYYTYENPENLHEYREEMKKMRKSTTT